MLLTGDECASILDVCEQFCDKADAKKSIQGTLYFLAESQISGIANTRHNIGTRGKLLVDSSHP